MDVAMRGGCQKVLGGERSKRGVSERAMGGTMQGGVERSWGGVPKRERWAEQCKEGSLMDVAMPGGCQEVLGGERSWRGVPEREQWVERCKEGSPMDVTMPGDCQRVLGGKQSRRGVPERAMDARRGC